MDKDLVLEKEFNETFDATYKFLMPKNMDDLEKEIKILESTVESLYVHEGNDWVGRGELITNKINAQVAATEALLHELKEMRRKQLAN